MFVLRQDDDMAFLLVYVDDIVLTASSTSVMQRLIANLHSEFAMKDLGSLHFFLSIQVRRSSTGFFLSLEQYAEDLLERASMANCTPASTLVDTKPKVSSTSVLGWSPFTWRRSPKSVYKLRSL